MLQAMFEYPTMICRLIGMEVSTASHYDGATSLAEASRRRGNIVMTAAVHPQFREVVKTYLAGSVATVVGDDNEKTDASELVAHIDDDTAALVVRSPNFFGQLENLAGMSAAWRKAGALLIVAVDPIALGLFGALATSRRINPTPISQQIR